MPLPQFGLALREARRARKLSQLDLAGGADISQRHLSFLECGRARPSRVMVLQLSEAMGLALRDRNHLLVASGFAPIYPERRLDSPDMAPVQQALDHLLRHHEPYPALVLDRRWNVLQVNAGAQRLLSLLGDPEETWRRVCGDGPRNLVEMTLHPQGLRPLIRNLEQIAPDLIGRLQREALDHPRLLEVLDRILAYPGISKRWASTDLRATTLPVLPTQLEANGMRLNLFTMLSTFGTPQDLTTDELRVETMFPADPESEALLRRLAGS